MTVYVDSAFIPKKVPRMRLAYWSHVTADSKEELHEFARRLGMLESWFRDSGDGRWFYEVTKNKRTEALALGAVAVSAQEIEAIFATSDREGAAA